MKKPRDEAKEDEEVPRKKFEIEHERARRPRTLEPCSSPASCFALPRADDGLLVVVVAAKTKPTNRIRNKTKTKSLACD